MIPILEGYKTYIMGALMVLVGVLELFGIHVPAFGATDPGTLISAGLATIFMRNAVSAGPK